MFRALFRPKRPEPSYPRLPHVAADGRTTVPGLYAAGEIAGTPLIKHGLNEGHELAARLADALSTDGDRSEGVWDLVVVGAGAAGLSAAATGRERGLSVVVLEANHLAETVHTMTKGKRIFAEPEVVSTRGPMWFEECTKEELLAKWTSQVEESGLDVRTFEKVEDVRRRDGLLEVRSTRGTYLARRVVLAAGKAGNPRRAGVPGEAEHAAKIEHRLVDPDRHRDEDLLVYGGGDVALEAALALCDTNRVTLVTIDPDFVYPSRRNADAVRAKVAEGRIDLHFDSRLESIGERDVTFAVGGPGGERKTIPNDRVFEMIGSELPLGLFRRVGIRLENAWSARRWLTLTTVLVLVWGFYALKSYGKGISAWPFEALVPPDAYDAGLGALFRPAFAPFAGLFTPEARADILGDRGYQQGYLYSLLYTLVMLVFGAQALLRWRGLARRPAYQTWRYLSLLAFQIGFFLLVNLVAVQALTTKYAWRAWGLYQPFPLFFNVFFWWYDGDPSLIKWFFVGAGVLGTFVVIPLLARRHGKRFCTWVCGCGGLAETLGDRWRHLSAKGERSRAWEFQSYAILGVSAVILLVVVGVYETDGNNPWWRTYSYLVDFWLVAVIPIALYPFFGGKVWCRYWCPLAAWNQVLANWFGRLEIRANDKCISCTQCSRHCQVGVDVMAFARDARSFDNRNSSCIQCGVCIDVCPMDVLSFGQGDREAAGA